MNVSSSGKTFIKEHECIGGKPDLTVYEDVAGYPTVGYGHKVTSADKLELGDKITKKRADSLFTSDISSFEEAANTLPKLSKMNQDQFDAVISLIFNVGKDPVQVTTNDLYVALNDNNTYKKPISSSCKKAVVKGFTYTKAGGKRLQALVDRRNDELNLFLGTDSVVYITMTS